MAVTYRRFVDSVVTNEGSDWSNTPGLLGYTTGGSNRAQLSVDSSGALGGTSETLQAVLEVSCNLPTLVDPTGIRAVFCLWGSRTNTSGDVGYSLEISLDSGTSWEVLFTRPNAGGFSHEVHSIDASDLIPSGMSAGDVLIRVNGDLESGTGGLGVTATATLDWFWGYVQVADSGADHDYVDPSDYPLGRLGDSDLVVYGHSWMGTDSEYNTEGNHFTDQFATHLGGTDDIRNEPGTTSVEMANEVKGRSTPWLVNPIDDSEITWEESPVLLSAALNDNLYLAGDRENVVRDQLVTAFSALRASWRVTHDITSAPNNRWHTDAVWSYTGTWDNDTGSAPEGMNGFHLSTDINATAELTFSGVVDACVIVSGWAESIPDIASVDVYLDNVFQETLNTENYFRGPSNAPEGALHVVSAIPLLFTGLDLGSHTIRIEHAGPDGDSIGIEGAYLTEPSDVAHQPVVVLFEGYVGDDVYIAYNEPDVTPSRATFDAFYDDVTSAIADVGGEASNVWLVDVRSVLDWQEDSSLFGADQLHLSDAGMDVVATELIDGPSDPVLSDGDTEHGHTSDEITLTYNVLPWGEVQENFSDNQLPAGWDPVHSPEYISVENQRIEFNIGRDYPTVLTNSHDLNSSELVFRTSITDLSVIPTDDIEIGIELRRYDDDEEIAEFFIFAYAGDSEPTLRTNHRETHGGSLVSNDHGTYDPESHKYFRFIEFNTQLIANNIALDVSHDGSSWTRLISYSSYSAPEQTYVEIFAGLIGAEHNGHRWYVEELNPDVLNVDDALHTHSSDAVALDALLLFDSQDSYHGTANTQPALDQIYGLAIGDVAHSHTSDSATIDVTYYLDSDESQHAHQSGSVGLTQHHSLGVESALHNHDSGGIAFTQQHVLGVGESTHEITSDESALEITENLAIESVAHGHISDEITLAILYALVSGDVVHDHASDQLQLDTFASLSSDDATHVHVSEESTLTQVHALDAGESAHAITSDAVVLVAESSVTVEGSRHALFSGQVELGQVHALEIEASTHDHASAQVFVDVTENLGVQGAAHAHAVQSPNFSVTSHLDVASNAHVVNDTAPLLTEVVALLPSDSDHEHTSDGVGFAQGHVLGVQGSAHTHASDAVVVVGEASVSVEGSRHGLTSDEVALGQAHALVVADGAHAHEVDESALAVFASLGAQGAFHGHEAEQSNSSITIHLSAGHTQHTASSTDAVLTETVGVQAQYTRHSLVSGEVALTQHHALAPDDAAHAHTSDAVVVVGEASVHVEGSRHGLVSDAVTLTQHHGLVADGSDHEHTSDAVDAGAFASLTTQSAAHALVSDESTVALLYALSPGSAQHGVVSERVTLVENIDLITESVEHAHGAMTAGITQTHDLVIADAVHGSFSDASVLASENSVTVNGAKHAVVSDEAGLTQHQLLGVDDAAHAHTAGQSELLQSHVTSSDDSLLAHTSDDVSVAVIHQLGAEDADHVHVSTASSVTATGDVGVGSSTHTHAADEVVFSQHHQLDSQSSEHDHASDTAVFGQTASLAPSSASHAHTSDEITVTVITSLVVGETAHAQTAATTALTQVHVLAVGETVHEVVSGGDLFTGILRPDSSVHGLTSPALTLGYLTTPDHRVYVVAHEGREWVIAYEDREWKVPKESRTYAVDSDEEWNVPEGSRIYAVAHEDRTVTA